LFSLLQRPPSSPPFPYTTLFRSRIQQKYKIPAEACFADWEDLLAKPQLADAALVCTQDRMHTGPALKALNSGYHVMLEKPMATRSEEHTSELQSRENLVCRLLLE